MEQWELHEYASPIGTFFIKVAGSGRVIASSLKCGRDRAALIAAAPELLEVLKLARAELNATMASRDAHHVLQTHVLDDIDAAISKAAS